MGELIFTDNSSWNRSKRFRIGLKVATGSCGNTRIREAKTDAFQVKEHRGEAYMKHHPPASDDEVWRLENIAKGGKSHQKLSDAGIYKVEDFLLQLFTDPEKLREILGKSIP
ncbi:calmodulin-binding protein 60 C [Eucalyptus grandis]|uniref:calmodulin-binding protein 60 C n=1 Tax=Eucalyptus grandis TaxID=71139 RepID=UPI00192EF621|nr:calmodulin-binding protein 60 C [Eucalyptus grandis]